jgi:hypothetical protein
MSHYAYAHWASVLSIDNDEEDWDRICKKLNDASAQGWEVVETIKTTSRDYTDQYKIRFLLKIKLNDSET